MQFFQQDALIESTSPSSPKKKYLEEFIKIKDLLVFYFNNKFAFNIFTNKKFILSKILEIHSFLEKNKKLIKKSINQSN